MHTHHAKDIRAVTVPRFLLAAAGIAATATSTLAQECLFSTIPVPNPMAAGESAVAYDSVRNRLLLVESNFPMAHLRLRTWTGTQWIVLSTSGPSRRAAWAMAFDRARDRLVL